VLCSLLNTMSVLFSLYAPFRRHACNGREDYRDHMNKKRECVFDVHCALEVI
jgi:hypothetical protein